MQRLPGPGGLSIPFYLWQPPDSPLAVYLSLEVVERLRRAVLDGLRIGLETGGLLRGRVRGAAVVIEDFEPLASERPGPEYVVSPAATEGMAARAAAHGDVVGFWRSHSRPGFTPSEDDRRILAQVAPESSSILLMARPEASGEVSAGVFLSDAAGRLEDTCRLQFPLGALRLRTGGFPLVDFARMESPATEEPPWRDPRAARQPLWIAAAAAAVALAAAAGYTWRGHAKPAVLAAPASAMALGIAAEGDVLRLTWDRASPAVRDASMGILWIEDGVRHSQISLDARQLTTGSVAYAPSGLDVSFRLEVLSPRGTVDESVRYIAAERPARRVAALPASAPLPVSEAAPQPLPAPAAPVEPPHRTRRGRPAAVTVGKARPAPSGAPSGTFVPPVPLHRESATAPPDLRREVPVEVRVLVDETGAVQRAEAVSVPRGGDSLAEAALDAARLWKFSPARWGRQTVASEVVLRFRFGRARSAPRIPAWFDTL